jgi:hypothetical protein
MKETWADRIAEEQDDPTVELKGQIFNRVRYGDDCPDGKPRCRDCGVAHGQIHVFTCVVERCPRCGDQACCCDCWTDDA